MRHLVIGGTGTVGSAVARGLVARGEEVVVLTRGTERSGVLPRGALGVAGDLREPSSVRDAFDGVDRVFLLNALSPSELQEGLVALNEARRAGVSRIVYLSVFQAERLPDVPHFASKVAIERAIAASGVASTVLRPGSFFENDLAVADAILQRGAYPLPFGGVGVARVDVRDIADAAVAALTGSGHEGRTYPIVSPDTVTGEACARLYSDVLRRKVRYAGDDLEELARRITGLVPGWMVYDIVLMYRHFQREGLVATAQDLRDAEAIVAHPLRRYRDFAADLAAR